jgi:branched-chain amino acid transport system ATP-binding protein
MLSINNVTVRYGTLVAVSEVSLEAPPGEVTAVIGRNGSGKSSLLKATSGLVRRAGGSVTLAGQAVSPDPAEVVRQGIAQVPEGRQLFPLMSVRDNLLAGSYLRRDWKNIAADIDKVYGYFPVLKVKSTSLARNLSGGEQQMLAFGRAIMSSPKVLLLDEPSVGLAPMIEQSLMATIKDLAEAEKLTVLLVEQNATLALKSSAQAYVLDLGRVVMHGPAAQLLKDDGVQRTYLGL